LLLSLSGRRAVPGQLHRMRWLSGRNSADNHRRTRRVDTPFDARWLHRRVVMLAVAGLMALWPAGGEAHDASTWGGLFRSRNAGTSWFQANQGHLVADALAVAVDPIDSNHLLLGTDAGLLASRNGGLDWETLTGEGLVGPVFAVTFDERGVRQLAATDRGLGRSWDAQVWQPVPAPAGASPARLLVRSATPGRVYLVGWRGLFRGDDMGSAWTRIDSGLPDMAVTSLVVVPGSAESLLAVAAGQVWQSTDGGSTWQARSAGLPAGRVQTVALDTRTGVVWAGGADRLFRCDDVGEAWQQVGGPLPEGDTEIRGIAADPTGTSVVVSTHRGLYATTDSGATWTALVDNLPGHLEAGPLVRDPAEPATLYAAFSLTPYDEQWTRAAEGRSAASRLTATDLIGALAFLLLLGGVSAAALRWLSRHQSPLAGESA